MTDKPSHTSAAREDPSTLLALIELNPDSSPWQPFELTSLLRHQLKAPLAESLSEVDRSAATMADAGSACTGPPLRTFADLLEHPSPPLPLLIAAKRLAKLRVSAQPESSQSGIWKLLYYACIAAARVRAGVSISDLPDTEVARAFQLEIDQPVMHSTVLKLLREALSLLAAGDSSKQPVKDR
jgi:hypothetical protein